MRYTENQIFRISTDTFDQIDDWIRAAEATGVNARFGLDALAMLLARTNQAFAMEMSAGVIDPGARHGRARASVLRYMGHRFIAGESGPAERQPIYAHDDEAWKLPVRRITSRYYKGWKVRRVAPGVWMLTNDSREAFYIEFGIHPTSKRRVRRPVRKLSLMKTMRFVDQSRAGDRVWEAVFAPFRPGRRITRRGDLLVSDAVQSVAGMRNI